MCTHPSQRDHEALEQQTFVFCFVERERERERERGREGEREGGKREMDLESVVGVPEERRDRERRKKK